MTHEQYIIIALCRCAIAQQDATDATKHQILRLQEYYLSVGHIKMSDVIKDILTPTDEVINFKIVQS